MTGYNITRSAEELLAKYELSPPSFSIHLYPDHWTLNNGPRFLYNNPVASLLDDVRAHRIPVDYLELFDSAGIPFYDGCMVVELLDYRPKKPKDPILEKPERSRVTLHPNNETLWADLCLVNQRHGFKFTDLDALELEAQLLLHTTPPLCLDPDPHLTRIANHALRASTSTVPKSLKRKATAITPEEDESDKARRAKIMHFMNPRLTRTHSPSYRILETLRLIRDGRSASTVAHGDQLTKVPSRPPLVSHGQPQVSQPSITTPSHTQRLSPSPQTTVDAGQIRQSKKPDNRPPSIPPENSLTTATPTPHPAINQLQAQASTRSPPVISRSPLLNAYQPVAARSPAQRGYTQSPRPSSAQASHSSPLATGSHVLPSDTRQAPKSVHFFPAIPETQSKPTTPQVDYSVLPNLSMHQAPMQLSAPLQQATPPQSKPPAVSSTLPPSMQAMYSHLSHNPRINSTQVPPPSLPHNGGAIQQGAALARSPVIRHQAMTVRGSPAVQSQPLSGQMMTKQALQMPMSQPTMPQASMPPPAPRLSVIPPYSLASHHSRPPSAPHESQQIYYSLYGMPPGWQNPHPWPAGRGPINGQAPGSHADLVRQMQVAQGKPQAGVQGR